MTTNDEVLVNNKGFEQDPELGVLYEDAPCTDCYELIGKRTLTSKMYAKNGTQGKEVLIQNSTAPMHYKDANGKWRTLHTQLHRSATRGIYAANEQEIPIIVDATQKTLAIGADSRKVELNRNLELVFVAADGAEQSLGIANWNRHTAGNDGVYITNAWAGVDVEMFVIRGGVKTNFIINKPMPEYAGGKLVVRDHMLMAKGLSLYAFGHKEYGGNIEVVDAKGTKVYALSRPIAFEKEHIESSLTQLNYTLQDNNVLDIGIPGSLLNKVAAAYPVVIDPLILDSTTVAVPGSSYTNTIPYSGGCTIVNNLNVPAAITVTDMMFTFTYVATGGAIMSQGAYEFHIAGCKSPTPYAYYWYCNVFYAGTCTGTDQTFFPDVKACIPNPVCSAYVLPVTMYFYQTYTSTSPCSNTYIMATTPLTIIVAGHTVEMLTTTVVGPSTICQGDKTQLSAFGHYGVGPYTYTWTPGSITGQTVTVTPSATTTFTCTITDQCGNTDTLSAPVTVIPNDNKGFTMVPAPACTNSPVTISGLGAGAPSCYNWVAAGSDHPTVSATQTWTAIYTTAGTYKVFLNYQSSFCVFPDSMQLVIQPLPDVTASGNTPVCAGGALLLHAFSLDTVTYSWIGPGSFTSALQNPVIHPVVAADAGTYAVTATNRYGCVSPPSTVDVSVVTIALGTITPNQIIHNGSSVQLDIQGGVFYKWTPDNGTLSNTTINNPVATPIDSVTTYKVVVMNAFGCRDSATVTISLDYSHDFIPTAFTPNGDGLNDVFRVGNAKFERLADFEIYDRWGQLIFKTNDKTKGWDGTFNGEPMDMGVYHYMIMISRPDNTYEQFKGDVTLIR